MNYPRDLAERGRVINHAEHKQTQARPLFFHRELMSVQKNFDPAVLFPCAESKVETERDKDGGGGGGATTASSVPTGNAV